METASTPLASDTLKRFETLRQLSDEDLEELWRNSEIHHCRQNEVLFRSGHRDSRVFFLLTGEIQLIKTNLQRITITAGSMEASRPYGSRIPGHGAAVTLQNSQLISFDGDLLDLFFSWYHPYNYLTDAYPPPAPPLEQEDWTHAQGLRHFSAQHLGQLRQRMTAVHYLAGEEVVTQGSPGDGYYFIQSGRCLVSRRPNPDDSRETKLAQLQSGDGFGEEALLANKPRDATVRMLDDGILLYLSTRDFNDYLVMPLLHDTLSPPVGNDTILIDLRTTPEANAAVTHCLQIPLPLLRLKAKMLDRNRHYAVFSDNIKHSAVAAFILSLAGFDACFIEQHHATALGNDTAYPQGPERPYPSPAITANAAEA